MSDITLSEVQSVVNKAAKMAAFSMTKFQANRIIKSYVSGDRTLEKKPEIAMAFFNLINLLDDGEQKDAALHALQRDFPFSAAFEDRKINALRRRSESADQVDLNFARTTLEVYRNMGIIKKVDYEKYKAEADVYKIDEFLSTVRDLSPKEELKFAESVVNMHADNINCVPPHILAYAYESLSNKIKSGKRGHIEDLYNIVAVRIDDLSNQFAGFNPEKIRFPSKTEAESYNFVDVTNIADTYDGYRKMFAARLKDFAKSSQSIMAQELTDNIAKIDVVVNAYDEKCGLTKADGKKEEDIEKRLDAINQVLDEATVPDDVKEFMSKYKFLDKNGRVIPQFVDAEGVEKTNYEAGCEIIDGSRLNQVVDLTKNDVAMQNIAQDGKIDADGLHDEFVKQIPFKLFEIDSAYKNLNAVGEKPESCTDPEFVEKFVEELTEKNRCISDDGYNKVMEVQVAQTVGFAARLKSKIKSAAVNNRGNLFGKLFKRIDKIDKRAGARLRQSDDDRQEQKFEFCKRIFKTYGNSLLVSSVISGISLATGIGAIGIAFSMVLTSKHIAEWRRSHNPNDIRAFFKDRNMVISVVTTALAATSMGVGMCGLPTVAAILGAGAIIVGGAHNAFNVYKAAMKSGYGKAKSISLGAATALAALLGGLTGRLGVRFGANAFAGAAASVDNIVSADHQDIPNAEQQMDAQVAEQDVQQVEQNTQSVAQQAGTEDIQPEVKTHIEYKTIYTDKALSEADRITRILYQDDLAEMQRRVDLITEYNLTHEGEGINPQRLLMLNADAGAKVPSNYPIKIDDCGGVRYTHGNVKVLTLGWLKAHPDFTQDDIDELAHLFDDEGNINEKCIEVAKRIDPLVSEGNRVGNAVGKTTTINGVNTYTVGKSAFETKEVIVADEAPQPQPQPSVAPKIVAKAPMEIETPVTQRDTSCGMGMFGMMGMKIKNRFTRLRNRLGTFMDNVYQNER